MTRNRAVLGATVLNVQRQCARPGCSLVASATFTFDAAEQTVWLDVPADDGARAGELCERHVQVLTPPQGWRLDDRRGKREAAAHELAHTLDARSPLLSRAFRNSARFESTTAPYVILGELGWVGCSGGNATGVGDKTGGGEACEWTRVKAGR